MNINEIRLELLEIAAALDNVVYDNGPSGEECLCSDEAQRIRELVDELKGADLGGIRSGNDRFRPGHNEVGFRSRPPFDDKD